MQAEYEPVQGLDRATQQAITELEGLIQNRYPEVTFVVSRGDDPAGIYLTATIDVEDADLVLDMVVDRLLHLQVEEQLPIYVVPVDRRGGPNKQLVKPQRAARGFRAPHHTKQ